VVLNALERKGLGLPAGNVVLDANKRRATIFAVEEVVGVELELQADTFANLSRLEDAGIEHVEGVAAKDVSAAAGVGVA
jgi:hypothetical protein